MVAGWMVHDSNPSNGTRVLLQDTKNDSGAHPVTYSMDINVLSRNKGAQA